MRHLKKGRKLSRKKSHRQMMLSNLASSLILNEKIKTTEAKAKEVRGFVEKLIRKSKENTLAVYRQLLQVLAQREAAKKLMKDLAQRFQNKNSGFLKIYKLGKRKGDGASMVLLAFSEALKKEAQKEIKKEPKKDEPKREEQ